VPIPPSQRGNFTQTNQLRRCPGAASQPPEDKSAPFTDDGRLLPDCDPNQVPPGP
jgi:phospholipid/cholesterol/gamma-HCH transport system substrate-binding protein